MLLIIMYIIILYTYIKSPLCVLLTCFSSVRHFVTLWPVAHQAPLSLEFSRQEYWSEWPCLPPGNLSDPGIELMSLMSPALPRSFFTISAI